MILLFEDNRDLAFLMKRLLSAALGTGCIVCSREQDAESEVFSGNVDMIVSDLNIFGKSEGVEFLRRIRKVMPFTCPPIVVYTGMDPESRDYDEARSLSDAVYEKGETSISELCGRIKRIFSSGYASKVNILPRKNG